MGSTCITQWGRRCSLLFPDTENMFGVCLARTVRHHTTERKTGLGHKEGKRHKIFKQAEKLPVALEPYPDKWPYTLMHQKDDVWSREDL